MKPALAWAMIVALLSVTGVCPLLASSMPSPASCCPHSKAHRVPCSESAATNCPYVLLEKAKSERELATFSFAATTNVTPARIHPPTQAHSRIDPQYYADSSDSYLFLRILRL